MMLNCSRSRAVEKLEVNGENDLVPILFIRSIEIIKRSIIIQFLYIISRSEAEVSSLNVSYGPSYSTRLVSPIPPTRYEANSFCPLEGGWQEVGQKLSPDEPRITSRVVCVFRPEARQKGNPPRWRSINVGRRTVKQYHVASIIDGDPSSAATYTHKHALLDPLSQGGISSPLRM